MGKRTEKGKAKAAPSEITDARFASVQSDPKFMRPYKHKTKVKVDGRFSAMFEDEDFGAVSAPVDKYGRKTKKKERKKGNDLRRFYHLEDGEDEEKPSAAAGETDAEARFELLQKMARGELDAGSGSSSSSSSSSSEEESDDEEEEEENQEEVAEEEEAEEAAAEKEIPLGGSSCRLAVMNCQWDRTRAVDLMSILQSFLPATGSILRVTVHPSKFGQEQMALEDRYGPGFAEVAAESGGDIDDIDEDDGMLGLGEDEVDVDGANFDREKLRRYEKNKLKYYFAVVASV